MDAPSTSASARKRHRAKQIAAIGVTHAELACVIGTGAPDRIVGFDRASVKATDRDLHEALARHRGGAQAVVGVAQTELALHVSSPAVQVLGGIDGAGVKRIERYLLPVELCADGSRGAVCDAVARAEV